MPPTSTPGLPPALLLPFSVTVAYSAAAALHTTLLLFPLLTFTPGPVAVYRHSISVTPVDKRNFGSHLRAGCYFRGS